MKSRYEKLFPNFKPPSKLDSDIVIRAKQYIQQRQKKLSFTPRMLMSSKSSLIPPKDMIQIPSIITVSLSNQLEYQKNLKSYERLRSSTTRKSKNIPKLNLTQFQSFHQLRVEQRSQNLSKADNSIISPWTNR